MYNEWINSQVPGESTLGESASGESLIALDNSSQTLHNSSVWIYFLYTGYKCRVCEEFFMNIINIEHISKIYGEKVIYEDASF
ncbi:MAG TPA: hypothetical protein H9756_12045, partial [Candidatus Mediterraneibacter gallistercoris]|nr:hypothetical protein [Candidatus Mediterraneibacter gallistercoris]